MKTRPLISIIVVTRNEEENIGRCLASICKQSFPFEKMEIVVVDNFSDDLTPAIVGFFPARLYRKGPERNAQRPYGALKAKGKYLMFIDADMALSEGLVEGALFLAEKKGFDALILPEEAGGRGFWAQCQRLEKRCYWQDSGMETPNRFMKKEVYRSVGGYDPDLIAGEDFDLGDRIRAADYKVGRTKNLITHYEKTGFWLTIKKKFYYGGKLGPYFKKTGVNGFKKFNLLRPAYARHWKLFLKEPLCGFALILLKICQWLAGGTGLVLSIIKKGK